MSIESPKNPRLIYFKDLQGSFEISLRINNKGMDSLNPHLRDGMTNLAAGFAAGLESAVDEEDLRQAHASTEDFLRHTAYRLQQVAFAALGGRLMEDPEKIEPTSDTMARPYVRKLAEASIKTQEGIENAKTRLVSYAYTVKGLAKMLMEEKKDPKKRKGIKGFEAVLKEISNRMHGMDEALNLILDKPAGVPAHIQGFVDFFNTKDQDPPTDSLSPEPPKN